MAQRILRKRQRLRCRTAAGPDRSEIGPYLGSLRATSRGFTINSALPGTSEVRRFLRKRHVHRLGPPQSRTAAGPDCSEIGPYLGSLRTTSRGFTINSALPGHLRGKAISPKAPRPQTWTAAGPDRSEIGPYLGSPRTTSGWPKKHLAQAPPR